MARRSVDDIPVAHTPPGGFGDTFPEPVLAGCTEPLVAGAPDPRGPWRAIAATRGGEPVAPDDAMAPARRRTRSDPPGRDD